MIDKVSAVFLIIRVLLHPLLKTEHASSEIEFFRDDVHYNTLLQICRSELRFSLYGVLCEELQIFPHDKRTVFPRIVRKLVKASRFNDVYHLDGRRIDTLNEVVD